MDPKNQKDFPACTLKAFKEESYARAFLNEGKFRLGALKTYQSIEDNERADPTEGNANFQFPDMVTKIHFVKGSESTIVTDEPGLMTSNSSLGNPVFIFSTCLGEVDTAFMRNRFGPFVVEISDPRQFTIDLQTFMDSQSIPTIGLVYGETVEYTKGTVLERDLDAGESARLSYVQKPPEFSDELEYRFVSILGGTLRYEDLPGYVEVDLGKKIEYARMLTDVA